jgi:hypothetical protein
VQKKCVDILHAFEYEIVEVGSEKKRKGNIILDPLGHPSVCRPQRSPSFHPEPRSVRANERSGGRRRPDSLGLPQGLSVDGREHGGRLECVGGSLIRLKPWRPSGRSLNL